MINDRYISEAIITRYICGEELVVEYGIVELVLKDVHRRTGELEYFL